MMAAQELLATYASQCRLYTSPAAEVPASAQLEDKLPRHRKKEGSGDATNR